MNKYINKIQYVAECDEDSNPKFWKELFPKQMYKHRNRIELKSSSLNKADLVADGDIYQSEEDGKLVTRCADCHEKLISNPKMFGTVDVGYQLIYTCAKCGKGYHRIYTPDSVVEKLRT